MTYDPRFWLAAKAQLQFIADLKLSAREFLNFHVNSFNVSCSVSADCLTRLARQFGISTLRFSQYGRDILKFTHEGIEFAGVFSESQLRQVSAEFQMECIDAHLQEAGY